MKLFLFVFTTILLNLNLTAQEYKFYALSNDVSVAKPVYLCELDAESGAISVIEQYGNVVNGNYYALSPDYKHLLVTSKNGAQDKAGLVQFSIADDGKLSYVQSAFKAGKLPCHVSFTPDQKYAMSADYGDDEISLYSFSNNKISAEIDNIVKANNSRGHYISADPSGKFVHAVFLGLDKVFNYKIEGDKLVANTSQATFSVPGGYGPRHMVFHKEKDYVYILNQLNSSIIACSYNATTGVLTEIENISMLPDGWSSKTSAAAIRIHPNGKFLYASNRGHNSIVVFSIESDGNLTFIEHETSGINIPRDFNISTDGKFMVVCNQDGNSVISFNIDETTGELSPTGKKQTMSKPLAIEFLPTKEVTNPINSLHESYNNTNDFIYPNPANDELFINAENKINKVELYNLTGQLVQTYSNAKDGALDVSNLPRGSYLIVANSETHQLNSKILLQ